MKPATQQRSREMCERILEAAFKVFSERGYADTNISDITTLAGCSVGIFCKCFSDKEGLFFTFQHRHFQRSHRSFDLILKACDADTPADIFRGYFTRSLNNMVANAGFNKAQIELALKDLRVSRARLGNIEYVADRLMQVRGEKSCRTRRRCVRNWKWLCAPCLPRSPISCCLVLVHTGLRTEG